MNGANQNVAIGSMSAAALVALSAAAEAQFAPIATFEVSCFGPRRGCEYEWNEAIGQVNAMREEAGQLRSPQVRDLMLNRAQALCDHTIDRFGVRKWGLTERNLVTTAGKNDLLDKYFSGSSYTAAWYCGLVSSVSFSAYSAADTMSSHAGWLEAGGTNAPTYSGNRPALAFSSASAGSKATSSAASFTFTGAGTIKGMFGTTVTTKDGTTGVLYNEVNFTGGDRLVASSDVVNVSVTYSAT